MLQQDRNRRLTLARYVVKSRPARRAELRFASDVKKYHYVYDLLEQKRIDTADYAIEEAADALADLMNRFGEDFQVANQ